MDYCHPRHENACRENNIFIYSHSPFVCYELNIYVWYYLLRGIDESTAEENRLGVQRTALTTSVRLHAALA